MKHFAWFALALLLFTGFIGTNAHAANDNQPRLYAVYFWASTCPNCKILTPSMNAARDHGELDKKDILFVTLDLTDANSIHQSLMLANSLGLGDYVKKQGSATGYVALVAGDKKTELARFDRTSGSADIARSIDANLAKTL